MAHYKDLLWPTEPAAQFIVLVIGAFLAIALIQLLAAWARLAGEQGPVRELRQRVSSGADLTDAYRHTKIPPESYLSQWHAKVQASGSDADRVYQNLAAAYQRELDERVHWPRFIGGICVFLGLLGTILGLGLAIGTIAAGSNDIAQLQEELRLALAAMRTGFSCTFYGVLASILVGLGISSYHSGVTGAMRALDDLFSRHVIAEAGPSGEPTFIQALNEAGDRLQDALGPFTIALQEGSRRIDSASSALGGTVPSLEGFRTSLTDIVTALGSYVPDIASAEADKREQVTRLVTAVVDLGARLHEIGQRLDQAVPSVAEREKTITESLETLGGKFGAFATVLAEHEKAADHSRSDQLAKLSEAIRLMHRAIDENPALASAGRISSQLETTVTSLDAGASKVAEGREEIIASIRHLSDRFDRFTAALSQHIEAEEKSRGQQLASLQRSFASLSQMVDLVEGSLQDAPVVRQDLKEVARDARTTITTLTDASETLRRAADSLQRVTSVLQHAPPPRGPYSGSPPPPPPPPMGPLEKATEWVRVRLSRS